ncbi:MAG TPA: mandelate racemase/muconate lactonizing enzyme family protein [Casimicrobiaceae bacterium]|nr:mandelate racemase/muconate lactonizing enzyme family protein [Casimicrobiaceae bacterium]
MTGPRITRVIAHVLEAALKEPFAYSQAWYDRRGAMIVEIETDAGITGWGEAFGPARISAAVVEHLTPLLIGRDALAGDAHWEAMYNALRDHGQKGGAIEGLSAIDIALWDIRGRHFGVPIATLLGGPLRSEVQAYATGLYRRRRDDHAHYLRDEAGGYVASGFRAVKLKIGFGLDEDIALTHALRDAVGPDVTLLVDANHAYDVATALAYGRACAGLRLGWFEEPVTPEDRTGYAEVRRGLSIPVAGGEAEFTRYGFRDLFLARAVDIAQPDAMATGGITESKRIFDMAAAFGVRCNPHVWGTGIGLAASLQLLAVVPHVPPSLNPIAPMLEFDCTEHPIRQRILAAPLEPVAGRIAIPTGPGLGIDVDRSALKHFAVDRR